MVRLGVDRVVDDAGGRVVAGVADSVAALTAVRTHRPDLLVVGEPSDVGMLAPGLVALTRKAAQLVPGLRSIALVSGMGPEALREVLTAGVSGLLLRNADPDELRAAVARVVAGEPVVSPHAVAALFGTPTSGLGSPGGGTDDASDRSLADGVVALTSKEREVLALLSTGRSNAEIAEALFVSAATVKTHLAHIYAKLGVRSRHQALARAVALGYLQ